MLSMDFGPKRLQVLRDKITSATEDTIVWDKHGNHRQVKMSMI